MFDDVVNIKQIIAILLAGLASGYFSVSDAQPTITLDPSKAISQYAIDQWTTEDGLPMKRVSSVTQTADGYIWLGTQEGLVRFDGFDFVVFDKRHTGLESKTITCIFEDSRGILWIGTIAGLSRYRSGQFETLTTDDGLSGNYISSLIQDADGRIWVGTFGGGISLIDGISISSLSVKGEFDARNISALYKDITGDIWIGTTDAGLLHHHDGELSSYSSATGLPSNDITRISGNERGTLWIGTKGGLSTLKDGAFRTHDIDDGLPSNIVRSIHEDAEGSLWVGTEGGLSRLRNDRLETYVGDNRLNSVLAIQEDMEGSLWVGTQRSGLFRIQDGTFTTFTTAEGLGGNSVYSVYEDTRGDVWAGTLGAGVSRIRGREIMTLTEADGLQANDIVSIYGSKDGTLWFGTAGLGLVRYRDGVLRSYTSADGLPGSGIYTIFEDSRGTLWLGTGRSGLVRFDGEAFVAYTTSDGLTDNSITSVTEGPPEHIWVGTYHGGLNLMKDGVVIGTFATENGLPNNYVSSIYQDDEGVLWIATREGGLTRLKEGELKSLSIEHGMFNDTILQILEDDDDNLWLSSNRGLSSVRKTEVHAVMDGLSSRLEPTVFDRSDGLTTFEFNGGSQPSGWKDREGRLWFVSSNGVVRVDPDNLRRNDVPPPVVVERVVVMDDLIRTDTTAILAPGNNSIEFDYIGLSFIANEEVTYRYRLEGIDRQWVDAGSRRQAFYTNLPPGQYTFRVAARNADGVWSENPATFTFYLKPFFHQTPWFYILVGILLVLVAIALYRIRVRQLKSGQIELENIVRERTTDLRREKRKVEQSKAVIEVQAEQLRELDRVKTRFFSNISHEFRTPLTLNIGPLENALSGLYGPIPDALRGQLTIMLRNARRLLRLINQLLDLSKLEHGGLELHTKRLDLAEFARGVAMSFSGYMEQAGIDLAFDVPDGVIAASFDPEAMEKVLFNLMSNAVKFTPQEGRIKLAISGPSADGNAEMRISDSGIGIDAAELPHIFDRFHQAEGSSSSVQQGTGIGLALVKELVELHGGSIGVESEIGRGTTFTISIPVGEDTGDRLAHSDDVLGYAHTEDMAAHLTLYENDEAGALDGEQISPSNGIDSSTDGSLSDSALILVADDNPDIRNYVVGCLKGKYRTVSATNGRDAFEKAMRYTPDLIISDVMMPHMTGYDLCRAVRAEVSVCMTPIILVTSKAAVDDKIEGLEAGADDYLPKPFNAEELFARVRNLLTLRKQQNDLQDLNDRLQGKNVELEQASDLKSQLLRIAAHDLKNPLNNIREFANLIREEVEADSEVGDMLGLIERSSNQMFGLISQILESEALESGKLRIEKRGVDLSEVAASVVESNRKQAERKSQQIVFDVRQSHAHVVSGSAEWLMEAMDNLVSNAIKYSPPGKKIWVTVRRSADEKVDFEVRDEGPGLTDGDKSRLFQKFQRLSSLPTGGETSTGLGLSIVKQIAEMHDGDVVVESERGVGSAFIIRLDAQEAAAEV